ncbi:MAG: T9SS type A sorting domain-containing protein [Flavobacteriaceae bacterium]|jgi:hypothetical protein|nr:T9SS type A sorting domain-containing protein [Flavobacteriaceae bacterium]MBT4113620.1 T9SS type A sorting domain-containing protein [Flavobacteriaceae bacterium]MBT4614048.1 T9SS type A sorting domain-containing protein [Flavobacteriaceae bacterium]MBT5246591.1 T9SS type A sorting domain-containing protein [Flavobacteriaceae bacterium]MBT5650307.1 T9SS type A sorting domain-containing protein [Flavobacteriaceae bacterium]
MNTRSIFSFIITFIILSVSAQQSDIINNYLDDNIEKFSYQTKDINVSNLSSGIYILNINNSQFETNYKIIIE